MLMLTQIDYIAIGLLSTAAALGSIYLSLRNSKKYKKKREDSSNSAATK
jgi:hypothetical protein